MLTLINHFYRILYNMHLALTVHALVSSNFLQWVIIRKSLLHLEMILLRRLCVIVLLDIGFLGDIS